MSDGHVASAAADSATDNLMSYFKQNELSTADDIHKLSIIKHCADFTHVSSQKQSSCCDVFNTK